MGDHVSAEGLVETSEGTAPCAESPPAVRPEGGDPPSKTATHVRFAEGTAIGHYEVIRPLGQGGMGSVYLARDTRLGRRVALKFLRKVDAQRHARFLVEARATAQLTHESIVALYDIAEHAGMPYMVLEYVQGKTLAAWLRERVSGEARRTGVPPARAAELMLPVARALACAHDAGVVHRDLKPSNLMLADSGTVKVLDFGVAKLLGDMPPSVREPRSEPAPMSGSYPLSDGSSLVTQTDALIGTRAYMAPEQWNSSAVDGRTDLWAVGIILYQLVTGEHPLAPVSAESLVGIPRLNRPMPSVLERLPDVGRLGKVIDRCLIKPMDDRIGSARELCTELEAIARPHLSFAHAGQETNPYVGLSALKEEDAACFFGRDREVEQVVARLSEQPLLAIVGSSGAGKSSLVRAGVIPALKRSGDGWEAFVLRPGPHPLAALAEMLLRHAWQHSSGASDAGPPETFVDPLLSTGDRDSVVRRLYREPGLLGVALRARARRRRESILIFVDQLEELVTLASEDERGTFLDCLTGAADDASAPLRVVVSVRQDFLDRVAGPRRELAERLSRGTVLVGPMGRSELRSALVEPAAMLGYRFEPPGLVDEMLDALGGAAGALPLLQFTAAKLWEGRDRDKKLVTEASYRTAGGVGGALASHADSVLASMSNEERIWARVVLLHLVTPERTRAVVTLREVCDIGGRGAPEPEQVLERLVDARLVTVEGQGRDENTVELVHESLIESWPALARWLEEEQGNTRFRARLRVAAREWLASGRDEGLLWRGEAAQEARHWQKRNAEEPSLDLGAREIAYLGAVVALAERERRTRRRIVGAVIAGLCGVVVLVSMLALRSNREAARAEEERMHAEVQRAEAQRQRAEVQAQKAEADRSASIARNATRVAVARERQADPTTVLALLREIEPGPAPRGWAELARWARGAGVAPAVLVHDANVEGAAWSPDGQHIVTASWDHTVRVWSIDGSRPPVVLRGHDDQATLAAWSPDGQRIVSASYDKTVRVWNADGSGEPTVLRGHDGRVYGVAWSPDGKRIVSASEDRTVRVWSADGSGSPLVLRGHGDAVRSVAWSPDGKRIVSASWDKTVRVWNADGSGQPTILRGHDASVSEAAWRPDGQRIASASYDKTVRVWNADGSGQPTILRGHDDRVYGVAWSPDGQRIVSTSQDKTVRVWKADGSGQPLILRGHDDRVYGVAWSRDGQHIVSASWDKTARVWNADGSGQPLILRGHQAVVAAAVFSPDGQRIASGSWDKTVRVWKADGSGQPLVLRGHDDLVYAVAWSPDGQRIASGSYDRTARVFRTDGSGQPLVLRGHEDSIRSVAWRPDGQRLATASWDKTIRVWNADGSGQPLVLRGHDSFVFSAAWSPDGERIASASFDKTVRIWNADGSGQPLVLRGHDEGVYGVAWTPDGKRIVSSSWDKTVRVWNADGTGQPIVLRGHEALAAVRGDRAVSPDGKRLVSSSDDGSARVWNVDGTGDPLVLRASGDALGSASWSPDGKRIVAASNDKTVIVWNDLEPLVSADDPKLWTATSYCMPLELRRRLLSFTEEQSRLDLEGCQRRVREAAARAGSAR